MSTTTIQTNTKKDRITTVAGKGQNDKAEPVTLAHKILQTLRAYNNASQYTSKLNDLSEQETEIVVAELLNGFTNERDVFVRGHIAEVFGTLGKKASVAVPTLIKAFLKGKHEFRAYAQRSSEVSHLMDALWINNGRGSSNANPEILEALQKIRKEAPEVVQQELLKAFWKEGDYANIIKEITTGALEKISKDSPDIVLPALLEAMK